MKETMDIEELDMITSIANKKVEIWVEDILGSEQPITDYEYDFENNRIILIV